MRWDVRSITDAVIFPLTLFFIPLLRYSLRGGKSGFIRTQADQPVIEIEKAAGAEIRDLTLTRSEGDFFARSQLTIR